MYLNIFGYIRMLIFEYFCTSPYSDNKSDPCKSFHEASSYNVNSEYQFFPPIIFLCKLIKDQGHTDKLLNLIFWIQEVCKTCNFSRKINLKF